MTGNITTKGIKLSPTDDYGETIPKIGNKDKIFFLKMSTDTVHIARGEIANSMYGGYSGYGMATVMLYPNGTALINYGYVMTGTPNSGSDKFYWGLNRDSLHRINSNIPIIEPINYAGVCMIYNSDGTVKSDRIDYCGTTEHHGNYWTPSRVYATDGSIGAWQEETMGSIRVMGTCYGTYSL